MVRFASVVLCSLVACDLGTYERSAGGGGDPPGSGPDANPTAPPDPGGTDGGGVPVEHPSFPIDPGTTHGAFACADCHADLAGDVARMSCTGCHLGSHDQAPMEVRHREPPGDIKGVGDLYAWESAACVTCHPQSEVVTRPVHSTRRLVEEGVELDRNVSQGKHDGKRCSDCHLERTDLARPTYAAFQCRGCHEPGNKRHDLCAAALGAPCADTDIYDYWYPDDAP